MLSELAKDVLRSFARILGSGDGQVNAILCRLHVERQEGAALLLATNEFPDIAFGGVRIGQREHQVAPLGGDQVLGVQPRNPSHARLEVSCSQYAGDGRAGAGRDHRAFPLLLRRQREYGTSSYLRFKPLRRSAP